VLPLLHRILHRFADVIELRTRAQRPHLGSISERVANANLCSALHQFIEHLLSNSRLNKHPRTGHTALPGGAEIAGDDAIDGSFQIGIIKHQNR
jgi:hypothetical protein